MACGSGRLCCRIRAKGMADLRGMRAAGWPLRGLPVAALSAVGILGFRRGEFGAGLIVTTAPWSGGCVFIAVDEALDSSAASDSSLVTFTSLTARGTDTDGSEVLIWPISSIIFMTWPVSLIPSAIDLRSA